MKVTEIRNQASQEQAQKETAKQNDQTTVYQGRGSDRGDRGDRGRGRNDRNRQDRDNDRDRPYKGAGRGGRDNRSDVARVSFAECQVVSKNRLFSYCSNTMFRLCRPTRPDVEIITRWSVLALFAPLSIHFLRASRRI
jgi:hypothetical protein